MFGTKSIFSNLTKFSKIKTLDKESGVKLLMRKSN